MEYEPGKKYLLTARSSVQLLSIGGVILNPPDTYTGVLNEHQLDEVSRVAASGLLSVAVVEESETVEEAKEPEPKKESEPVLEKVPEKDEVEKPPKEELEEKEPEEKPEEEEPVPGIEKGKEEE